jgi:hypothetical protein
MATTEEAMAPVAPIVEEKAAVPAVPEATTPDTTSASTEPAGPRYVPFEHPEPAPAVQIPSERTLQTDQSVKYESLLRDVLSWTEIPTSSKDAKTKSPLTEAEKQWLTQDCLLRYLRAVKWFTPEAAKRLQATLVWRREYGVTALTPEHVSPENETGKQYILGWDNVGHPLLYLNPALQNTDASPRQVQHLVFMLERVIEYSPKGQESLGLVINFGMSSKRPSLATGKEVLSILQNHYPERLGKALILNRTFMFSKLT